MADVAIEGLKEALEAERQIEPGGNLRASWEALFKDARECTRCDLYKYATQTVFGEGPLDAAIMFVGEQPGDQEDVAGRPFVGPAGAIFDASLEQAGIDRGQVYVTNAVKHFKFIQRGKRRIHNKPDAGEISACRWWIEHERELIRPPVTVALGATAARSLVGKVVTIGKVRGEPLTLADGSECWVTVHPSFLAPHSRPGGSAGGARAIRPRPEIDPQACRGDWALEPVADRRLDRARRARGDIIVAVRGREIMGAEDILDIELRFEPARQLGEQSRVDAGIAGKLHRIADRRIGFRARDQAEANADAAGSGRSGSTARSCGAGPAAPRGPWAPRSWSR